MRAWQLALALLLATACSHRPPEADTSTVRNRAELLRALAAPHQRPRTVQVLGHIRLDADDSGRVLGEADFRDPAFSWAAYEQAYAPATWGRRKPEGPLEDARRRSAQAQARHVVLRVPSHTTLLGLGTDAQLSGGMLLLDGVEQVRIDNLHLTDAHDHFPAWDPADNGHGEWNAEYDLVSLRNARQVWVQHCSFDNGPHPAPATRLGRPVEHHDGLLDITHASNQVTVAWNIFRRNAKAVLVGGSDSRTSDAGHLKVSFHHNLWQQLGERAPRVRYGQVHVFNNLYDLREPGPYAHGYSLGVGHQSQLLSQHNVWLAPAGTPATALVRWLKGSRFADQGSLLNGQPVDLLAALRQRHPEAQVSGDVGWQPAVGAAPDPAEQVAAKVLAGAGAGRAKN